VGAVLVVNAGSTSLKLHVVHDDGRAEPVPSLHELPSDVSAVAHRVVHGGPTFTEPTVVNESVLARIAQLEALAPLHNQPAVEGISRAREVLPGVPHVAVFDTAFHAGMPEAASSYALPRCFREELGVRRYGFHGLSLTWCCERAPELVGRPLGDLRLVVCHLGGGSSVTAIREGRSLDTTMGFSPLEGVPMTTRSGSVDPAALLYLLREAGVDADTLDHVLNHDSGLRGLSEGSGDMRELEQAARSGDAGAVLAIDVYAHRLAGAVAAMAAAAGGLDAVVFTAGIGEHSSLVRERVCARLRFLGVELDPGSNVDAEPDCDVATSASPVRVVVVRAREELVAAREARRALAAGADQTR
jgi:acetate kinase